MPTSVNVLGSAEFNATMSVAQMQMADLPGFADAGQELAHAGRNEAPRLTGRLAGSLMVTKEDRGSATVTSPLVYAVPIHWGRPAHNIEANPFLMRAADREQSRIEHALEHSAQSVLNRVRGI